MQKPIIDNSLTNIRSNFDMSFNWLGTTDFGVLRPFHVQELIPTDKVKHCIPHIEMQMLPLASPTFGKMDIYVHYFFVPTRLLWNQANDFFSVSGVGVNYFDSVSSSIVPPFMTKSDLVAAYAHYPDIPIDGQLNFDEPLQRRPLYKHLTSFGLPPFFCTWQGANIGVQEADFRISTLPLRAYNAIWWDFYRDPELVPDNQEFVGGNSPYYTRKGQWITGGQETGIYGTDFLFKPKVRSYKDVWLAELFVSMGHAPIAFQVQNLRADQSVVTTSNNRDNVAAQQLRKMEALTRMSERLSLSGKREIDRYFALYGVKPDFQKMELCQYLGGAKETVLVSDITSSADTYNPEGAVGMALGQKAGSGYCHFDKLDIDFEAHEHGYLIGIVSIMPHVHFHQGIGKQWSRNSLDDFFRKELEHTGQVAVAKREVAVACGANQSKITPDGNDADTFAFTQPYYEYKRNTDILAGDFSWYFFNDPDPNDPALGYMQSMGMYINYPLSRTYSAENMLVHSREVNKIFFYQGGDYWENVDDHFQLDIDIDCVIERPMDGYAVPTIETTEDPHKAASPVGTDVQL